MDEFNSIPNYGEQSEIQSGDYSFLEKLDIELSGLHFRKKEAHSRLPNIVVTMTDEDAFNSFGGPKFKYLLWRLKDFALFSISHTEYLVVPIGLAEEILEEKLLKNEELISENESGVTGFNKEIIRMNDSGEYEFDLDLFIFHDNKKLTDFLRIKQRRLLLFQSNPWRIGELLFYGEEVVNFVEEKMSARRRLFDFSHKEKFYVLGFDNTIRAKKIKALRNSKSRLPLASISDVIDEPSLLRMNSIDYSKWQQTDATSLVEHIYELFETYFDLPRSRKDWLEFQDFFIEAFVWSGAAVVSGIIGNLAYDILLEQFRKRKIKNSRKKRTWDQIEDHFEIILDTVIHASMHGERLRAKDISKKTKIPKEKVKLWFKLFGGKHFHSGRKACTYKFNHIVGE